MFKERSAQRRPHGIVRTDELPERPEWSTAGTTDILPAVHIPELFTYPVSFTSKLFPPLRGPITVIEANQAGVVGHFWSQN